MATVYKRGKVWWAQYFDADGKRVAKSTGCTKKREAERTATSYEAESRRLKDVDTALPTAYASIVERAAIDAKEGRLTLARAKQLVEQLHQLANPEYSYVTLKEHLNDWTERQGRHVAPSTAKVYEDMVRRVTGALGAKVAGTRVGDLTSKQVEDAIHKIHDGGLKASTTNMDLRALRRALEDAVQRGLAATNVAKPVRPLKTSDSVERAPFTKEEFQTLLRHVRDKYAHDEWEGAILIAGHTGLRLRDVVGLARSNIVGTRLVVIAEKTGATVEIPMTPPVLRWIGEKEGQFFPILGDKSPTSLSTTFVRIMSRAEVPRDIVLPGGRTARRSFHSLRHSFASWLADADVHADVRKKLTGHKADGIHQKYSHHDKALDKAIKSLPNP